jgi:predicted ATPase/DNA-binding CsgD family transcriptional regulator
MSVQKIAAGLADRSHLLSGAGRDKPARHKTLRASIEWSCGLLQYAERTFLHRLSVFASDFTIAAAEAVCGGDEIDRRQVMSLLASLVDKSLVHADPQADRFRLHDTMRAYGAAALEERGETDEVHDRHFDYFAELAVELAPKFWTSELAAALTTLEPDLDNLRAALDWGIQSKQVAASVKFVLAVTGFFYVLGLRAEAWQRCERLLEAELEPIWRLEILYWASWCSYSADPNASLRLASELVALGRSLGDQRAVARGLCRTAVVEMQRQPDQSLGWLDDHLALAREVGDVALVVTCLYNKATTCRWLGRPEEAFSYGDEALRAAEEADWLYGSVSARRIRAAAAIQAGRLTEALQDLDVVEDAALQLRDPVLVFQAEWWRGDVYMHLARPEAEEVLEQARTRSCSDIWSTFSVDASLGQLWVSQGRLEEGYRALEAATANLEELGYERASVEHQAVMADVAVWQGDPESAHRHLFGRSGHLPEGSRTWQVPLARAQARLARAEGKPRKALALGCEALEAAVSSGCLRQAVELFELVAMAFSDLGHAEEAARLLGTAEALRERTGYVRWVPISREVEPVRARTEEAVGRETFARAVAEGRALTLEAAVAYARRGRGKRTQASAGWDSLTPSERRVARLVAQRLTNAEIAQELFVSCRTVKAHVSNAFAKLGVRNRRQLAAVAKSESE